MTSTGYFYSFAHSNIGTCSQLVEKLRDLSEGAAASPPAGSKGSFCSFQGLCVRECVVSERHVALLLDDGRVCRVRYCEETSTAATTSKEKSDDEGASTSSARSLGSRSVSPRPESEERGSASVVHALGSLLGSSVPSAASASQLRSRSRILLRRRGVGRSLVARWPLVPASDVPDDLVDQAMAVLQGKSREIVTRELQRTSLDVNQAVNNLLSRDDDGGEGGHEEGVVGFFPSGEELLNLLGSGLAGVGEEELEEALGRGREEGGGRESRVGVYEISDPQLQSEIRSLVTLGDSAAGGGGGVSWETGKGRKKRKESTSGPQLFDNDVEWWGGEKGGLKFQHIAGLYSDLLGVDLKGRLHGWSWQSHLPHSLPLTLEGELGLEGEKIRLIAAKVLRASILTESGKVASWLDRRVSSVSSCLEHRVMPFPELAGEAISQLLVCELFTAVSTDSGKIFWWGMLPFTERKQVISNVQDRVRLLRCGGSRGEGITHGSRVCIRTNPIYAVGSKAIHLKGGQIQCGILQESVFSSSLTEKVRFQVVTSPLQEAMDTGEQLRVVVEGVTLGSKRKFSEDIGVIREEMWSLRDVIFTEIMQTVKVGTVVKVDGCYMAVHYPALDPGSDLSQVNLSNCRLLRRDELVLCHDGLAHQTPTCIQESPKKLRIPATHQLLGVGCDTRGVHAMSSARSLVHYLQFNLNTGKQSQDSPFSELVSQYLLRQGPPMQLIPVNLSLLLLLDRDGGLYPLARDIGGGMKDLPLLNLPPVTSVGVGVCSSRNCLITVGFRRQALMSAVVRCDVAALRALLEQARGDAVTAASLLSDCCSGGCNVLHALALLGRPPNPSPSSQGEKKGPSSSARTTPRRGVIREFMKQAVAFAGGAPPPPAIDSPSWSPDDLLSGDTPPMDAAVCVELLTSLPECWPVLEKLMRDKNLDGHTPFMAATACKAYDIALRLFDLAEQLSAGNMEALLAMVCPADSHADDNPVFALCRNDACSFTWTGEEHVQQDIFECHTCGLTGSLCCCTECAYNCHRGHDCTFKRASPTAYCDCWERGKCCALAPGDDAQRQSLLLCLLKRTPLGTRVNAKKEHLLGMLAGTVARQSKEQSHWSVLRSSTTSRVNRTKHEEIPVHDLAPPKFAQKALSIVMEDWECVRAALQSGVAEQTSDPLQSSTTHLDVFTHTLLAKLSAETLDSLLTVLVKRVGPSRTNEEAVAVCQRFLRSVVRVYTVCQLEATNIPSPPLSSCTTSKKKSTPQLVERAEHVLSSLAPLAVFQLVPMARALILPVSMGMARPVHPLCMGDRHKTAMEMFSLPPTTLLRVPVMEEEGGGEGGGDADTESEIGDGEESVGGVPTHDASSTATIGSNPLYLSDQDSSDAEEVESGADDASLVDDRHDDDILDLPTHRAPSHSHWALPLSHPHMSSSRLSKASLHREGVNMGASAAFLAQTFSLLVRQTADCLERCWDLLHCPTPPYVLPVKEEDPGQLYQWVWGELEGVWRWLVDAMDMLESQLCLGDVVSRKISKDPPRSEPTSDSLEGRKAMFSYVLTLLRGQYQEHGGAMPAIDVAGMEHLAWCMDSLFYLLQNTRPARPQPSPESLPLDATDRRFFRRSPSTCCLGYVPPSPFNPLPEALPLAERPHLLEAMQAGARDNYKTALFGFQHATPLDCWPKCPLDDSPILKLVQTDSSTRQQSGKKLSFVDLSVDQVCGLDCHQLSASLLVGRWRRSTAVFSMVFMESVGKTSGSFLAGEQSFQAREKEFRREMDALRTSAHRDIVTELDRARDKLLPVLFQELNLFCERHGNGSPPLCVRRMKVTFQGEPGEGSGVLRSLFTAISEDVLSEDSLPPLKPLPSSRRPSSRTWILSAPGEGHAKPRERQRMGHVTISLQMVPRTSPSRCLADVSLFYQPGKPGFYAPRAGGGSPERLNAYRNVGRMMGLALLHTEVMPLPLCRHIFKYILGREIGWQDLAFFDPVSYESLRKLILTSREGKELRNLGVTFCVTLCPEEGGESVELVPGGSSVAVTAENVYEYVRKYTQLRMIHINEEPLRKLREGVYDVLPESALSGMSAEDFRLILCGCAHIDIDVLRSITIFDDESRKEPEVLTRYKTWFWSLLDRFTPLERQELLYFWTGSPALPASTDSYQPPPSVTLRPPSDQHLPTANTCISRLYLPLYSSRAILRNRLLTAIKTRTFGFV